jgi:tellurite resistance protein TerC
VSDYHSLLQWGGFLLFIGTLLAIDLGVIHRKTKELSFQSAVYWTAVWIGIALLFNIWVYLSYGQEKAFEFLAGYLVEKALSVDNIFVFLVLFSFYKVEPRYQHKVLFYGILGAILMRGFFIALGSELVTRFDWILLFFGAFLIWTGVKLLQQKEDETVDPEKNFVYRAFRKVIPSTDEYDGANFFTRKSGKLLATPLFFVLVAVELTDLAFATDSIPAIFAITRDPFIIFSSNIMAILGLRALYFVLASAMKKLPYLKVGLSLVLVFIGAKMLVHEWIHIPITLSLGVIVLLLGASVLLSLRATKKVEGA